MLPNRSWTQNISAFCLPKQQKKMSDKFTHWRAAAAAFLFSVNFDFKVWCMILFLISWFETVPDNDSLPGLGDHVLPLLDLCRSWPLLGWKMQDVCFEYLCLENTIYWHCTSDILDPIFWVQKLGSESSAWNFPNPRRLPSTYFNLNIIISKKLDSSIPPYSNFQFHFQGREQKKEA